VLTTVPPAMKSPNPLDRQTTAGTELDVISDLLLAAFRQNIEDNPRQKTHWIGYEPVAAACRSYYKIARTNLFA